MMLSKDLDLSLYNPANWPDWTPLSLRIGWIDEYQVNEEDEATILKLIPHITRTQLVKFDWQSSKSDPFKIARFFEQIEVLIWQKAYHQDPMILSIAAAMGRVILTDSADYFPFNHGENALVVSNDPRVMAEALIFLNMDPKFRATLGKNLRRNYLALREDKN